MSYNTGPKIVTDGLVLCLDAADTNSYPRTGTVWYDQSGNGSNGTLTNGPTFSSANGGSIVFDGVNDYVTCGTGIIPSSNFTISSWFSFDNYNENSAVFGSSTTTLSASMIMYVATIYGTASNQLRLYGLGSEILVGSDIRNSGYRHLSVVRNGNNFELFLEGNSDATGTASGTFYSSFIIGNPFGLARPFSGNIASTSIYNRALSANEISQNYNATKGRFGL